MKNVAKRHIPGFVQHDESDRVEVEFETEEQLLDITWVKKWRESEEFVRYTVARDGEPYPMLMVELRDGSFWCLAWLRRDVPFLPSWKRPKAPVAQ